MDRLPVGDAKLQSILIGSEEIRKRLDEMAVQITKDYGEMTPLCVVGIFKGVLMFLTDLTRALSRAGKQNITMGFLRASTYGDVVRVGDNIGMRHTNIETMGIDTSCPNILLLDDILDQGFTLSGVCHKLKGMYPNVNVKTCILLKKNLAHPTDEVKALRGAIEPDYVGFTVEDRWVVGYGLDAMEKYRELPYVALADEKAF